MKKLFTLWLVLLFGLVANAQTKFVKSVPTLTELRALNVADIHTNVLVNSYWTSNTNSVGALFQWVPGATDATNTTSVFAPASGTGRWIRVELPANPGSATQPGFRFLGDDNTGIYNSGADAIDFSTGGSRRWGITSSGVLQAQGGQSISTTASSLTLSPSGNVVMSPGGSSKWTFNSSGNLVGTASYGGIYGGSGVPLSLNSGSGTDAVTMTINGTEGARLATTGYLGVGTTGPDRRIDSLDANNLQYRATFTDGTVYSDWGTLSTGATLWTNSLGHRMTSTTVNDTSVFARQVQGGLAFDGVTNAKDLHTLTTDIGTSDCSVAVTFQCPSTNPSAAYGVAVISSSSTTYSVARSIYIDIESSGQLVCYLNGSTSGYARLLTLTGFVASYGGRLVNIVFVKSSSGNTAKLYVNGVDSGASETIAGPPANAPAWTDTVTSTYAFFGQLSSSFLLNTPIFGAWIFNRALSASEVITLANQGVQEADKWGGLSDYISNTVNNGGFETASGGVVAPWVTSQPTVWIASTAGTTTFERDTAVFHTGTASLKITCNDNIFAQVYVPNLGNRYGKRMRLSFWAKADASTSNFLLNLINATTVATPALTTSWTPYSYDFVSDYNSSASGIRISTIGSPSGRTAWFDDITLTPIGSILDADLSAGVGYQVPDRSSNKYHGVVSATGSSWTMAQRRGQIRYTTTGATTGAFQLLSSTAIPANALIQSIVAWSAGTPLVYVGNATGTSNIAVHTTLAASTYTKLALTNDFSTTGNLWLNKSATNEVNLTVNYMIADP